MRPHQLSLALRRSFCTSPRYLRKIDGQPPSHKRVDPPKPSNDQKPHGNYNNQDDESQKAQAESNKEMKDEIREKITGMFKPRSEHFIFAFANSKLSRERRVRSGLLLLAATIMSLLLDPFLYKETATELTSSSEERFLDSVREGSPLRSGSS